jgi:adenosylmethionine-8-amino-7-oxononanoate aminotransferase
MNDSDADTRRLVALDRAHVWHPFTPMQQWRETEPLVIERAERDMLIDTTGRRYIDGVSSLWCNVHGHRVPELDEAIRAQLDKVAHTTLLGLASPPSIELAAQLAERTPGNLRKVFYSDSGATALEVAFKMSVGYWHHSGHPAKTRFVGLAGAYHGDTTGSMSVGFSELFHRTFASLVFPASWFPAPDPCRPPADLSAPPAAPGVWPSEDAGLGQALNEYSLVALDELLEKIGHETAAVVVEPLVQGAAGMICQPEGFLGGVAALAKKYDTLLVADEVATGFGRTGTMFACEQESVAPDILCLGKGITGGYLPLAATLATDAIEAAFCGDPSAGRTLYHGHTYTGNPLACAVALASLERFDRAGVLERAASLAEVIRQGLEPLRECPRVLDVRQRGLMVGIELCQDRASREPFDFSRRTGAKVCAVLREKGVIVRPLGDVVVLMPAPGIGLESLTRVLDLVVETICDAAVMV